MPSERCGFMTGPRDDLRQCTRLDGHEDGCVFEGRLEPAQPPIEDGLHGRSNGWPDRAPAVVERAAVRHEPATIERATALAAMGQPPDPVPRTKTKTRTQAEIEAEKAAKPRPDLLPPKALSMYAPESIAMAFLSCASYLKTRELIDLQRVWIHVLDECVGVGIAETPAGVLLLVGEIMGVGLRKHGPCTWRVAGTEQADPQCHYASAVRHMLEHCAGIETDPDSGRHPLLHAVCQIAIMINLLDDPPTMDGKNDGRAMIGAVR